LLEQFGKDFRFGDDGHEVGVTVPAGDDVDVQVLVNARPRTAPQIQPDVESLRLEGFPQNLLGDLRDLHQLRQFLIAQPRQTGHMAVGHDHQMPVVVRESVQDDESAGEAGDDVVFAVTPLIGLLTKDATLLLVRRRHIRQPPWRPKDLSSHRRHLRSHAHDVVTAVQVDDFARDGGGVVAEQNDREFADFLLRRAAA